MSQSVLSEHVEKKGAIELCPACFKPITPYWTIKSMKPLTGGYSELTSQRTCDCGYREETKSKIKYYLNGGCFNCSSGCNGGCK